MQLDRIEKTADRILYNVPRIGNVFFVHAFSGDDNNPGYTPKMPLLKIATALGKCVNDNDDYIFVIDCYQQDTFPIAVNKTRVHIIGIANAYPSYPVMLPTGDTAIFTIGATGIYSEIAKFNLSGGTNHGCIELTGAVGVWLHHLMLGGANAGGTPQDGILFIADSTTSEALVEDNFILGSGGNCPGKITRDGIRATGTNPMTHTIIRRNTLQGCPGIAIDLNGNAQGAHVLDNRIACDEDAEGVGITLGAGNDGCWVDGNHANYGDTAMAANPYKDNAAAGQNHWGLNYKAGASIMPA